MCLLALANTLQTIVLAAVCYFNYENYFQDQSVINLILIVAPAFGLLIQIIQNIWVCSVHRYCLGQFSVRKSWLAYIPAELFTFHVLSMVNVYRKGQTSEESYFECYLRNYKRASQLSFVPVLPVGGLLIYQSITSQQSRLCLDAVLVMLWTAFYLQSALSYPPEDHIVWSYILKETIDGQKENVENFGKSFELHTMSPTPVRTKKIIDLTQDQLIN